MTFYLPIRYKKGQILLFALIFAGIFATVSTALVGYMTSYGRFERTIVTATQALTLAEGALDKTISQLNQNPSYTGETGTLLGNGVFSVAISNIDSRTKQVTATGYVPNATSPSAIKVIKATVAINDSVISFHYGIQSGQGGFRMENSSEIIGNVHSTGAISMLNSSKISGDAISAGATGQISGAGNDITGSAYAHTLSGIDAGIDAYYVTQTSTKASGSNCPNSHCHPNSPDQATVPLPISDTQISQWETAAAAGGTATCSGGSYNISSGSASIGPLKIPCNLNISGSSVVTVGGHIWVTGNIIVQNSAKVKMAASLGASNVAIIADKPTDRLNGSTIKVQNSATFENSGTVGSFVFLISQNNSAENGGDEEAFELSNSASALVAYAAHGLIPLANSIVRPRNEGWKPGIG